MRLASCLAAVALFAGCGLAEPDKKNRAILWTSELQDITFWDRYHGATRCEAYMAILSLDPPDSIPGLISSLTDATPTKIDDNIHRIPTVGDVAFHMLLRLFEMKPSDFENEGVWVGTDPVNNPIYNVHLDSDTIREKVKFRFIVIAKGKGWLGNDVR